MTFKMVWIITSLCFLGIYIAGDLIFNGHIIWREIIGMEFGLTGGIWVCYLSRKELKWED